MLNIFGQNRALSRNFCSNVFSTGSGYVLVKLPWCVTQSMAAKPKDIGRRLDTFMNTLRKFRQFLHPENKPSVSECWWMF